VGTIKKWSCPDDGCGDCEDYVPLRRCLLIQAGWPREALLITVVRDREDDAMTTRRRDYARAPGSVFLVQQSPALCSHRISAAARAPKRHD
jgi:Bacterial transglutaminase-like cysteine proteinase BTLCP